MNDEKTTQHLEFSDNLLLSQLIGPGDANINQIENRFGVTIAARGNHLCAKHAITSRAQFYAMP